MAINILPNTALLATFDARIEAGDSESEAAAFAASVHDYSEDHVMSVIYARESVKSAMEVSAC